MTETCLAGPLALDVVWTEGKIVSLDLTWAAGRAMRLATAAGRALQAALAGYVAGERPVWPVLPLDWTGLTPFARRVLDELARVPYGQLVTYGWLAARAGKPRAARAVGRIMAASPFSLVYPCHRVIGTTGRVSGQGPGRDMRRFLLEHEGAVLATAGREKDG